VIKSSKNKYLNTIIAVLFIILDYFVIVAAEQSSFWLRNFLLHSNNLHISWLNFWVTFPVIFILFMNIVQLYSRRMPFYAEVQMLFKACCYSIFTVVLVMYLAQISAATSRLFVAIFGVLSFIYLSVFRYITKRFMTNHKLLSIPVLIIGAGKTAEILAKAITNDAGMGYRIIGLLEDNKVQEGILEQYPVLGTFSDVERVIKKSSVERVFIAAPGMDPEKLGLLIFKVQPLVKKLAVIPSISGAPMSNVEVESMFYEQLLILRMKNHLENFWNVFIKTVFDYTLTIIGTMLISPILAFIAIKIKMDSPGPVIYDGYRLGKNGKLFRCYKFRSMYCNGDEILEQYFKEHPEMYADWKKYHKLENDPRVTPFGAFMRRTSLDELPQIFNVLLGHMSLVGPRPYLPSEKEEMGELADTVLIAKPGITGYWQTSGRSEVSFINRVKMDCWYICNWNLWIDIVMLFKTFAVVLNKKGAY